MCKPLPIALSIATLALIVGPVSSALACGGYDYVRLATLARQAFGDDDTAARDAVAQLRAAGPDGLQALLCIHREQKTGTQDPQPLRAIIDEVAQQKDAHASGLYWYTDFEKAKVQAAKTKRPILSLRLLGKLNEDLSCANSRFFRTALYANERVASTLSAGFVLHWQSVRPVPVVTIDFGDGRTICRTLTGNSIHYVMDEHGAVVDALPGLYSASAFHQHLEDGQTLVKTLRAAKDAGSRREQLVAWHRERAQRSDAAWAADLAKVRPQAQSTSPEQPAALRANTDEATWAAIGALHQDSARLDARSRALMAEKMPDAMTASRLTAAKVVTELPMLRALRSFERAIAADTVRNEYDFHRTIRDWFIRGEVNDVNHLNKRVYAQLFLTPDADPWLGLVPHDAYAALDGGGLRAR